jgi:phosphoheptose isomerase
MESTLGELIEVLRGIDRTVLERLAAAIVECATRGGMVYLFGNGGSAAIAEHFALDLERIADEQGRRPPLRALCLVRSVTNLTAYANDFGFKYVFSKQLESYLAPNDMAFAITASGASENILEGLKIARQRCVLTVGLTRANETPAAPWCDILLEMRAVTPALLETAFSCVLYLISQHIRVILTNKAAG